MPSVGREQPGPSQDLSGADPFDYKRGSAGLVHLERNVAAPQQIERPRHISLFQNEMALGDRHILRTASDQLGYVGRKPAEQRVLGHKLTDGLRHCRSPPDSMRTGTNPSFA